MWLGFAPGVDGSPQQALHARGALERLVTPPPLRQHTASQENNGQTGSCAGTRECLRKGGGVGSSIGVVSVIAVGEQLNKGTRFTGMAEKEAPAGGSAQRGHSAQ